MLLLKKENIVREYQKQALAELMTTDDKKDLLRDLLSDSYIVCHSLNVCRYSTQIAIALKMSEEDILKVTIGALLHDIGKLEVDRKILYKPAELTEEEYLEIQKHTLYGYKRLKGLDFSEQICIIARDHHEKLSGKGYLSGKTNIDSMVQIVTVADIFSALTEQRPYHEPYKLRDATNILTAESGINTKYLDVLLANIEK